MVLTDDDDGDGGDGDFPQDPHVEPDRLRANCYSLQVMTVMIMVMMVMMIMVIIIYLQITNLMGVSP